jgi:tetratricopeptide (TPR) repeat protein
LIQSLRRLVVRAPLAAALLAGAVGPRLAAGQQLPLKRALESVRADGCGPVPEAARPSPATADQARRTAARANEAALVGDQRAARDLYARAVALDPTDARLAYQLARVRDDLKEGRAAVAEYCRYLALAPGAPDGAEIRQRIRALFPVTQVSTRNRALSAFDSALVHYDAGRLAQAEAALDAVIRIEPRAVEAYYDRGVIRSARSRRGPAVADLEHYLELRAEAPDRGRVERQISLLRTPPPRPEVALAQGLVVPGMGQFYTRRPALGLAVLAGVGGAAYFALRERETVERRTFTDPFGNRYESTFRHTERPNRTSGAIAAGTIAVAGALEAYVHARRVRAGATGASTRAVAVSPSRLRLVAAPAGLMLQIPVGH